MVAAVKDDMSSSKTSLAKSLANTRENSCANVVAVHDDVRFCQSVVLEGCHYTMRALTGDKRPRQQWSQELEHRKEHYNLDCHPTWKV
ncbi:hypothetical protein L873DRAFT_1805424 [Choiromyces venosus 120613-1]|uniref:Uncharacterized protein n=1 Tax=Choiromyces venosus 120613-1 TaxID=1336337 RepID=A0A3N4JPQ1_9PEZI|nr:hypothetical protein L873DRAFT_1805424 [Choiromyces venosus 120613-1]